MYSSELYFVVFKSFVPNYNSCAKCNVAKGRTFSYYILYNFIFPFYSLFYSNKISTRVANKQNEILFCLHDDDCDDYEDDESNKRSRYDDVSVHGIGSNKRDDFCIRIIKMKCLIIIQKKIEYLLLFLLIKSYLYTEFYTGPCLHTSKRSTFISIQHNTKKCSRYISLVLVDFFMIHLGVLFLLIAFKRVFTWAKERKNRNSFLAKNLLQTIIL